MVLQVQDDAVISEHRTPQCSTGCVQTNPLGRTTGAFTLVWGIALGLLFFGLLAYSQQPGDLSEPPLGSALDRELDHSRYTLFVAVHPRCPCTAASRYELERLIARSKGRLHVTMLVYFPADEREEWAAHAPFGTLAKLDDVDWEWDENGDKASALGCMTSGSVVLYSSDGQPLFWGGITSSRGHAGDNAGSDTILEILTKGSSKRKSTPVFGCSLNAPDAPASGLERSNER